MKKVLTLLLSLGMFLGAMAQPFVSITNINAVTQAQLQNCDDTSNYLNQTIRTVGVVYIDGGLSEVASEAFRVACVRLSLLWIPLTEAP